MVASFKDRIWVAWADTDAAGIVHFSNYLRYFERIEEAMFRELGLTFPLIALRYGIFLPRVESRSKYLAPCRQGDELEIEIAFSQIRERSYEEEFTVRNVTTGKTAVEGSVVTVATSKEIEHAVKLPDEFLSLIKKFEKAKH